MALVGTANLIAGEWSPNAATRPLIDPATERQSGRAVGLATETAVAAAARAARSAFDRNWREAPRELRLAALERFITAIEDRQDDLAAAITAEIGAPVDFSRERQVTAGLEHLRHTLAAARAHDDDVAPDPVRPEHRVRYEPIGVAALITPWNWPFNQIALKVGAALAAGCAMVLKPSDLAPGAGAITADAMREALTAVGAPLGVFNLVQGDAATGAALVRRAEVDMISFTGSTRAGREIAQRAAADLKRASLELGGKSPNLVFADCHVALAVRQGAAHCFRNAGQSCNAASRMLVERQIYDDVVALAAAEAAATKVGAPKWRGGHLGPQVSAAQYERVQGYIALALEQGARLVAGGPGRADGFETGFYSRPTVFADVAPDMAVFREEIFGPVLTITPFEDDAEAVALANDSEYGLAAYVQSGDPARADRVARALRAGMVQVNGSSRAAGAPFGGVKASGMGREAGIWGVRAFQEIKSISGVARVG